MSRVKFVGVLVTLAMMAAVGAILAPSQAAATTGSTVIKGIIPTTPSCAISLVSGDPETAPEAPVCYDPSGSDLDEFLMPEGAVVDGYGIVYTDQDDDLYWDDRPTSTSGKAKIFVQAWGYDPHLGGFAKTHAWTLTFNTSVTAEPDANRYWVELGECNSHGGRKAVAFMENVAGADGRYIGYMYPASAGLDGSGASFDTEPVYRVFDGATVGVPLISERSTYGNGLRPGMTYKVKYYLEDRNSVAGSGTGTRRLGAVLTIAVPGCGRNVSQPPPSAKIRVVKRGPRFSDVKVVLGSKISKLTKYQVIVDPKRGKTLRKTFFVQGKVVKYPKLRKGTVVKVRFAGKVVKRRI